MRAWDIDGDAAAEIVPNCPGSREVAAWKLRVDGRGRGTGTFDRHVLYTFPADAPQGHGLGCGDVAGHGRMDIVLSRGWLEALADPWKGQWVWHPELSLGAASIPILVVDVNGDGANELVVGSAHGYGLDWWERRMEHGARSWVRHPIDPFIAQYHDLQWVDVDGDGACELVMGKRHRAHRGNEAGEWDELGLYVFTWTGESFVKQVVSHGPIGSGKGCGISFAVADLGTGRMDIVAPGKDGLALFRNIGSG